MNDEKEVPSEIEAELKETGLQKPRKDKKAAPVYQMYPDARVPVSKHAGTMWKARFDHASKADETVIRSWKEVISYFTNTAEDYRADSDGSQSRNRHTSGTFSEAASNIENVVYANAINMLPYIYSQNPTYEISATGEDEPIARIAEKLLNKLKDMRTEPGFNLKPKLKRMTMAAILLKNAYIVVSWTMKDMSSEAAVEQLNALSDRYAKAKNAKELEEIEGQLMALDRQIDFLSGEGPKLQFRLPWEVRVDPAAREDDLSDARWVMYEEMLPYDYVMATYAEKVKKGGVEEMRSIYKPTHVLRSQNEPDAEELMEQIHNFSAISDVNAEDTTDHKAFGFTNKELFDKAKYIRAWVVLDRTTRRIFLYNSDNWTWPLWVWEDPYGLDEFFNVVPISFYTSPVATRAKGESSYILDQQDELNEINSERAKMRKWTRNNLVYNKNAISRDKVSQIINGELDEAIGLDVKDGGSIKDVIDAVAPPSVNYAQLYDKSDALSAIDRISSTSEIMRGAQFKTNTTNDAVAAYSQQLGTRLDEKREITEEAAARIGWIVLQLCLQFMPAETVAEITNMDASAWRNMSPVEIRRTLSLTVVAGSTEKPTSQYKKREAIEVAQILGQFASASPVSIIVALRVFERSYTDVVITPEDWKMIEESIAGQLQGGGEGGNASPEQILQQAAQLMSELPPEAQKAIGASIARGVPVDRAVTEVVQAIQQRQQGSNPNGQ